MNYDKQYVLYSHEGIRLDMGSKYGSVTGIHAHDDEYQFEVLLSGESQSLVKKDEKVLPGFIDIYNPADLHEIDYRNTESFIFHLKIEAVKQIYSEMGFNYQQPIFDLSIRKKLNVPLPFICREMALIKDLKEMAQLNTAMELYQENKVLSLLKLILGEVDTNGYLATVDRCSQNKVEKAQKWIKENFYQEDITLSRLAELSHLSKFHFIRVFKNVYGKTPYEYLMEIRIKEAIKLLKRKKYRNMDEVCGSVGLRNTAQLRYQLKKTMTS